MTISEYAEGLKAANLKVVSGSENTVWSSSGAWLMHRRPHFSLNLPSREELRAVFKTSRAPILSFAVDPSEEAQILRPERAPGPAWLTPSYLYVCKAGEYAMDKLGQSARSHIRRSLGEFSFEFISQAEVLRLGIAAYAETRVRFGLPKHTRSDFEAAFRRFEPVSRYVAALKQGRLAAFMVLTEVDDWVTIRPGFSADEFLPLRPNNGLLHYLLHHYLTEENFRYVDHGLRNCAVTPKVETLHKFKIKMGFSARPVTRVFVVNPLLRPFINRASWRLANRIVTAAPRNPLLEKLELVLDTVSASTFARQP
jgi:hypothetical protein